MKLSYLSCFIFVLNAAVDTGKYQDISIEEVEKHIEKGDLLDYLKNKLGDDGMNLSLIMPIKDLGVPDDVDDGMEWIKTQSSLSKRGAKTEKELISGLQNILSCHKGDEKRKWGIVNSGLCLLIAWATELIQQRNWKRNEL